MKKFKLTKPIIIALIAVLAVVGTAAWVAAAPLPVGEEQAAAAKASKKKTPQQKELEEMRKNHKGNQAEINSDLRMMEARDDLKKQQEESKKNTKGINKDATPKCLGISTNLCTKAQKAAEKAAEKLVKKVEVRGQQLNKEVKKIVPKQQKPVACPEGYTCTPNK